VHISDDYFVPVGDCAARLNIERDLVFRFGIRVGDADMKALAAWNVTADVLFNDLRSFRFMQRPLYAVFNSSRLLAARTDAPPLLRDVWLGHADMQLMASRDRAGSVEGFYVAAWGSHNAQSHNHNDVGNVIIFADGRPFIIDVGAPTYTRQTFSSRRYEIPAMQSAWHNLPTINGVMQEAGGSRGAREVAHRSTEATAELAMDIGPAYPAKAGIGRWLRTVRLERGRGAEIIDDFEFTDASGPIEENFITPAEVTVAGTGVLRLKHAGGTALQLHFDAETLRSETDDISLDDAALRRSWGDRLTRIRLVADQPKRQDRWTIRFTIE